MPTQINKTQNDNSEASHDLLIFYVYRPIIFDISFVWYKKSSISHNKINNFNFFKYRTFKCNQWFLDHKLFYIKKSNGRKILKLHWTLWECLKKQQRKKYFYASASIGVRDWIKSLEEKSWKDKIMHDSPSNLILYIW